MFSDSSSELLEDFSSFCAATEIVQISEEEIIDLEVLDLQRAEAVVFPVIAAVITPPPEDAIAPLPINSRTQGLKYALTFPRCEADPQECLDRILAHGACSAVGFVHIVVAREHHADGGNHIHVSIVLKSKIRYPPNTPAYWDFVCGQHGNYQKTRSVAKWLNYVIKERVLIVSHPADFDPAAFVLCANNKKSYDKHLIAKKILTGSRDLHQLSVEHPAFIMMHSKLIDSFIGICNDRDIAQRPLAVFPLAIPVDIILRLNVFEQEIFNWLRICAQGLFSRNHQHLRIVGATGIGKTYISMMVQSFFKCYMVPYGEKWHDDIGNDAWNMCIFDEYQSQKTIQSLNSFCDASGAKLSRRGRPPFSHNRRIPCIMFTNFSWDQSYEKAFMRNEMLLPTLERRWEEVNVSRPHSLLNLAKFLDDSRNGVGLD